MSATTITPTSTPNTNTNTPADNHVDKQHLLQQLAKQLTYYFSTQNLSDDVYLQTIMKLNSGHVPISILANFAKVNNIIGRSGILLEMLPVEGESEIKSESDHNKGEAHAQAPSSEGEGRGPNPELEETTKGPETDVDADADVASISATAGWNDYTSKIHDLLRQAANQSELLSLVVLNQSGHVVQNDNVNDDKESSSSDGINKDTKIRTFDAIGPSSTFNGIVSDEANLPSISNHDVNLSPPTAVGKDKTRQTNASDNKAKTSIIILREVNVDATEEDIRQVFEQNQILSIQKEIGNCWFVTLDMTNSSNDLVTIMLNLRSKTICNESIKARLKTQTMAPSSSTVSSPSTITGKSNKNLNYRPNYHSSRYSYNNRSGGRRGGGMGGPSSSSSRGYYNQYSNQIYSGDRISYASKKYSRGSYGNNGSGGGTYRKQYQYSQRDGKGMDPADSAKYGKSKKVINIQPPPVGEEHYPSLGGGLGDSFSSPISVANTGVEDEQSPVHKTPNVVHKNKSGAYAAALLKDAPPLPSTTRMKPSGPTKTIAQLPSPPKGLNKKHENNVSFSSGKTAVLTVGTDDSSSDDKSSLSSKPDSESFVVGASATPSNSVWGGGRCSFADMVKK